MREMYCCSYVQKNIYLRIKYLICNSVTEYSYTRRPGTATPGDQVPILSMKNIPLKIVFEDEHLIVIEKREGLLSVGTANGRGHNSTDGREQITAHSLLNNYVRNTAPRGSRTYHNNRTQQPLRAQQQRFQQSRIYIVHRLDRETSGLMVFAKSEEIKRAMQDNWDEIVTQRKYVAVVNGIPEVEEGTFRSWLKENSAYVVYSSPKNNGGQLAITHFKVLDSNPKLRKSLMEFELETGRKNQIRVHAQEMGIPLYGDKKYYGEHPALLAENKKARRLYLHAYTLNFIHPVTGKEMRFSTGIPRHFSAEVNTSRENVQPAGKTPAGKTPAGKTSAGKTPAGKKPAQKGSVGKKKV